MDRKVITIDGLAGTGKTSISTQLAKKIGFVHFSTGLLYRTVGYISLQAGVDIEDEAKVAEVLKNHTIQLSLDDNRRAIVLLDEKNVSQELYAPEVSEATSIAAQYRSVREQLLRPQREAFPGAHIVAEGRDMGSVIFPDADVKFFIEVDEDVKVARRLNQMKSGRELSTDEELQLASEMKREIHERDKRDAERSLAPTTRDNDMILVNNSVDPLDKIVQNMYNSLTQRGITP